MTPIWWTNWQSTYRSATNDSLLHTQSFALWHHNVTNTINYNDGDCKILVDTKLCRWYLINEQIIDYFNSH